MLLRLQRIILLFGSNNVALNNASSQIFWIKRSNVVEPNTTRKLKCRLLLSHIVISYRYRLLRSQAHEKWNRRQYFTFALFLQRNCTLKDISQETMNQFLF